MHLSEPFRALSDRYLARLFLATLVPTIVLVFVMRSLGAPLVNSVAPAGIISYELAADYASSTAILESWSFLDRIYAGISLGVDFLFLFFYSVCIGTGCALGARKLEGIPANLGRMIAWGALAAGILDMIENISLVRLLNGSGTEWLPALATVAAIGKFALVITGLLFIVIVHPTVFLRSRRKSIGSGGPAIA